MDKQHIVFYYRCILMSNDTTAQLQIEETTPELLGERIRQARKMKNLSQIELAMEIGISDKAISSYEVGRAVPPLDILQRLSVSLNKPISYFFNEQDDRQMSLAQKVDQMIRDLNEIKELVS